MSTSIDTPIPCRVCGAPMIEDGAAHAVVVHCEYCSSREQLPADAAQRVVTLRQRLAEIGAARQALEAPALAIANLAERYPRMIAPSALMMLAVAGLASAQTFVHAFGLPFSGAIRANVMLSALAGPLQIAMVLVTVLGGTVLALRSYAAELRPALEARATDGNRYRCRACGGDMEAGAHHGAFVTCPYCRSQNLLGKTSAAARAAQLQRTIDEYRARAQGQQPLIVQAAARYKRRVQLITGLVAVANVLFLFATSAAQQYLAVNGAPW